MSASKARRLRPGQLDGLVLSYLAAHKDDGPLTATAIAKGIERSGGAGYSPSRPRPGSTTRS